MRGYVLSNTNTTTYTTYNMLHFLLHKKTQRKLDEKRFDIMVLIGIMYLVLVLNLIFIWGIFIMSEVKNVAFAYSEKAIAANNLAFKLPFLADDINGNEFQYTEYYVSGNIEKLKKECGWDDAVFFLKEVEVVNTIVQFKPQ